MSDRSAKNYMDGPDRSVIEGEIDLRTDAGGSFKVNGEEVDLTAVGGTPADGSITNAKLATDVKVGSLAALGTTEKGSVVGAINEVNTAAGAKYTKPGSGIPSTDMAAAVQALLELAGTAMQGTAAITNIRDGQITLNGANPTPVNFGDADAAVLNANAGPYDFTGVGNGGTLIVNPDGAGNDTATVNAAAGYLTGGGAASTDITGETDTSIAVSVDDDAFEDVVLTLTGLDSGAGIATALQNAIQALGGNKASATVAFSTDHYVITSPTLGTDSKVRVQAPSSGGSLVEELDLGGNAVATDGTGDCADLSAVTAAELVTVITTDVAGLTATDEGGTLRLTSDTTGKDSSLVMGDGTLNTALGFANTQADYGAQGLGFAADMADANYRVLPVLYGVASASLGAMTLSITSKTTSGFDVECETAAATSAVDLMIFGAVASA